MKRNNGFTLIELVIVIIVLGILSATAVPKFINLQTDAKTATLKGVQGAINSAINISYSKLAIDGLETVGELELTDSSDWCKGCSFAYGYPNANNFNLATFTEIVDGIGYNKTHDFEIALNSDANPVVMLTNDRGEGDFDLTNCYLEYSYSGIKGDSPDVTLYQCE